MAILDSTIRITRIIAGNAGKLIKTRLENQIHTIVTDLAADAAVKLNGDVDEDNPVTVQPPHSLPNETVYSFLRNPADADPATNLNMNVAGAVGTPIKFVYEPPAGTCIKISRINFVILDTGIRPNRFAGIAGGLTNGLKIEARTVGGALLKDFMDGQTIKINADFGYLAGSDVVSQDATGDDLLPIRWSLFKTGHRVKLFSGERFEITVQDDLTSISQFRAMLQGTNGVVA